MIFARKRLGVVTKCRETTQRPFQAASRSRTVTSLALGITTFQGAQPQGAASRRTPHDSSGPHGPLGAKQAAYTGKPAAVELASGIDMNTAKQKKRLAHDTGAVEMERGWK